MLRFRNKTKQNKAFTAAEMVVYIGIFSLVLGSISALIVNVYKTHHFAISQSDATSNTRKALEQMVSAIREASFADNGAYPVESMADNEMIFYSDIDNDQKVERVRLFIDNHTLKMGVTDSSGTPASYDTSTETVKSIAYYLRNTDYSAKLFTYKDSSGAVITDLSRVLDLRVVDIRVLVDPDPGKAPDYYDFNTSAALRNIINTYDKW